MTESSPAPNRQSEIRTPKSAEGAWVPGTVVAELEGITRRGVLKRAFVEDWERRLAPLPRGGREVQFALAALPEAVQVRALARLGSTVQGPTSDVSGTPGLGQGTLDPEDQVLRPGDRYQLARVQDRAEADRRLGLLQKIDLVLAANREVRRSMALKKYVALLRAEGAQISVSSYYSWKAAYGAEAIDGLVPLRMGARADGKPGPGRPSALAPADRALFLQCWGMVDRPKLSVAYQRYLVARELEGQRDPARFPGPTASRPALRYLVQSLSTEERLALRGTEDEKRAILFPCVERDCASLPLLDWVCMDHKQLNVRARDPLDGRICRPWITGLMELRSRRIICVVCRVPSQDSVLYCIAKSAMVWGGVFRNLYLDNGKEFIARAVSGGRHQRVRLEINEAYCRSLCAQLHAIPHFAIPKNAQAKPIERFFLTMQTQIEGLFEHWTGSGLEDKPDDEAFRGEPYPTLWEVEDVITGWLDRDYHAAPHHGDGMDGRSPNQVWEALIGQTPIRTASRDMLRYLLLPSAPVMVQRSQVVFLGQHYMASPENANCLYGHTRTKIILKYDPQDLSQVFAVTQDGGPIGYLTLRGRARYGHTSREVIRKVNADKRQIRALQRDHLAAIAAERVEPDPLVREQQRRSHGGAGAGPRRLGARLPAPPPGGARIIEMIPTTSQDRDAAAVYAQKPAIDDRRSTGPDPPRGPALDDDEDIFIATKELRR